MRAYLHVYLSLILRWQYTVTPTQLIKKFRGLDFSELYTLSSNPAALLIDKQLFSHAVLQFHGYGTIGRKGHSRGWNISCSPVSAYVK